MLPLKQKKIRKQILDKFFSITTLLLLGGKFKCQINDFCTGLEFSKLKMPRRRSSRIDTLLDESEHFTAGEDFSFEAVATPSGPMTRYNKRYI